MWSIKKIVLVWGSVALLLIGGPIVGCGVALKSTEATRVVKVVEKEPSTDSKPYRIFAEDGTTYSVEDSMWYWNFRASDRYGALKVGKTYECKTAGWRLGFFSAYRNLLDCTEVQ
jgi:hypothetical protein